MPRLAFGVVIECHRAHVSLDRGEELIEVRGLAPPLVCAALNEMRGDRSLDDIASESALPIAELEALCVELAGAEFLDFDDDTGEQRRQIGLVSPQALVEACETHFAVWKSRLFGGALWKQLTNGEAPRPMFLGWLIESYFFIEAATLRLPLAIAGARDPAVRRLYIKHFSEEFDHHHFFRRALEAAGLDTAIIKARAPLPTTIAIRNHMRECARRDPLAYAACSGFLESTGEDHGRAHEFFQQLGTHFDDEGGAIIGPLADHARLDEAYQHCGMLRLIAEAIGPVPKTRADAALESARLLVETLELWSADICRHYDSAESLRSGVRRYRPIKEWEPVLA